VAQCNAPMRIAHCTRRFSPSATTNITAYRFSKMNGSFGTTPISVGRQQPFKNTTQFSNLAPNLALHLQHGSTSTHLSGRRDGN
jgi:hypothetical protein